MTDRLALFSGIAFVIGILAVGISGNQRFYGRSLAMLLGLALLFAATGADILAVADSRASTPTAAAS